MKRSFTKTKLPMIVILIAFTVYLFIKDVRAGYLGLVVTMLIGAFMFYEENKRYREEVHYIENLNQTFDLLAQNAVFNMPFALLIVDTEGAVEWYNTLFTEMIGKDTLLGLPIEEVLPGFPIAEMREGTITRVKHVIHDTVYEFYVNSVTDPASRVYKKLLVYAVDNTADERIRKAYEDEKLAVMLVDVDNFDEVRSVVDEDTRSMVLSRITRLLAAETRAHHGILRQFESDKYLIILHSRDAREMMEDKMQILEKVREIPDAKNMKPTLSIGIAMDGANPLEVFRTAKTALDIALGRGGDQAVAKQGDKLAFFGGTSKATEKRTQVKSRVIAHALRQLIEESSEVLIMGHKNSDLDAFGAAVGILATVRECGKDGSIVLDSSNPSIDNLYRRLISEEEGFREHIISRKEALDRVSPTSLVVVVDTHRQSSTEEPKLLERTERIVLIDHHRRSAEYIENPTITYLEPYASSTCELVTEILKYISDKIFINAPEADALLAGIVMDTKNFFYQTGVRTFEAASYLKRAGADSMRVKNLFKDGIDTYMAKAEAMQNVEILSEKIAISRIDQETSDSVLIASEAADDFLNIRGVEASFVLTKAFGKIHISARSAGRISVQLIMERLGGGGHLTSAATQISGMNMDEAEKMLKKTIKEFIEEEE